MVEDVTDTMVHAPPARLTVTPDVLLPNPVPVIVIVVPPAVPPVDGLTDDTVISTVSPLV